MSQMHNPYAEERCKAVFEIGKGVARIFVVVFMSVLWIPPLWENIAQAIKGHGQETPVAKLFHWPSGQKLVEHLGDVEKSMEHSGYAVAMRQTVQGWMTNFGGEGSHKVFIGYNNVLFYQPDLKSLTGYGPLKPEPFSVMKDPEMAKLSDPKEVITKFATQLKERGIELLIVPVPLKPMLYSEYVMGSENYEWVTHPDSPAFYNELRAQGIDVLDVTRDLASLRGKRKHVFIRQPDPKDKAAIAQADAESKELMDAFMKQDTHWTPEGMRFVAEKVAEHLKKNHSQALPAPTTVIRAMDGVYRESMGDLVKMLDLKDANQSFAAERVFLKVIGEGTDNENAPIALLGDSFVNVFDDPTLGFENPGKPAERIRAGFAQHLSLLLQQPLDVIAMNGKGSTGVRKALATRYDDKVRAKKLVIWVIAARDLLLSKSAAREANIEWADVRFNPKHSPDAATVTTVPVNTSVVIEARLVEKSKNQNPNGSPYRDALHTALYDVEKVVNGKLETKQVLGIQWTFKEKI
ncbi:MAG: hypothetical protein WCN98_15585, partial [Verrucomicrobiaceae bacterium]